MFGTFSLSLQQSLGISTATQLLSHLLACRQTEASWLMQLVTAGGARSDTSPLHSARTFRASLGLQGDSSCMQ